MALQSPKVYHLPQKVFSLYEEGKYSASPHAITRLLPVQLFFNCTPISVITYAYSMS